MHKYHILTLFLTLLCCGNRLWCLKGFVVGTQSEVRKVGSFQSWARSYTIVNLHFTLMLDSQICYLARPEYPSYYLPCTSALPIPLIDMPMAGCGFQFITLGILFDLTPN